MDDPIRSWPKSQAEYVGYQSLGPTRARIYAGADYAEKANETVVTMAMIETKQALDNLDEILSVPGLDAIYIGPNDLHLSLFGVGGADNEDAPFLEALDTIFAACRRHDLLSFRRTLLGPFPRARGSACQRPMQQTHQRPISMHRAGRICLILRPSLRYLPRPRRAESRRREQAHDS